MKLKKTLIFSILVFGLSACQIMPEFKKPKNTLPEKFNFEIDQQQSQQMSREWWKLYQDELLNQLVNKAMQQNPNVQIAIANIEQADAQLREVGAALLPSIDLQSSAAKSRVSERGPVPLFNGIEPRRNTYNVRLASSFELDFWGKLSAAKASARASAMASRFAKETVVISLQSLVVNNYLLARSLEKQIQLTEYGLKLRHDSLSLTQRRFEGGVASALDVHQATSAYSNLQAQLAELQRQKAITYHQLALLTGDMRLKIDLPTTANFPTVPIPPVGLPSSLMDARPDIREAEQNLIAANADIAVARAALYPSISLTAYFGGESKQLSDLLIAPARIWGLGLGLNLPIFNGGRLQSKVDQVTALQKQLLAQYEAVLQRSFQEVNDALVSLRQQSERDTALANSVIAAEKALQIANNRYEAGYSGFIDVLDAERVLNDANLNHVQTQYARLQASVNLFKALGSGWQ